MAAAGTSIWHESCFVGMGSTRNALLVMAVTVAVGGAAAEDTVAPPAGNETAGTPPETRAKSDQALEATVGRALADDRHVNAMQIKIVVRQGAVTLTGIAADAEERDRAEAIVRRVPGVRQVENRILVDEPGAPAPGASMIPEIPAP